MTLLDFVIASFATFRLAHMFSKESGPFRVFKRMRSKTEPHSALREGITCLLCESVWWASVVTWAFFLLGRVDLWSSFLYTPAISGAAICIHFQFTKE